MTTKDAEELSMFKSNEGTQCDQRIDLSMQNMYKPSHNAINASLHTYKN